MTPAIRGHLVAAAVNVTDEAAVCKALARSTSSGTSASSSGFYALRVLDATVPWFVKLGHAWHNGAARCRDTTRFADVWVVWRRGRDIDNARATQWAPASSQLCDGLATRTW